MSNTSLQPGLEQLLISENLITELQAKRAIVQADRENIPLIRFLIREGMLAGVDIAMSISRHCGLPWLDLKAFDPMHIPSDLCHPDMLRNQNLLPLLKSGQRLTVAVSDPTDQDVINTIKLHTGCQANLVVVNDDYLMQLIEDLQTGEDTASFDNWQNSEIEALSRINAHENTNGNQESGTKDETPVVRFVNRTLLNAIRHGASDIHFEIYEKFFRIRFRQDGLLREVMRPPKHIAGPMCSRLKVMAGMNIAEKRIPQDGRIKLNRRTGEAVDFRANTLPTLWGEKVVLRIVDSGNTCLAIESLGLEKDQESLYREALDRQQGMILVTGPTGSGKTVTLYGGLEILNTQDRNIATAEDPVELNVSGINQVAVNNKTGLDFARTLRAFLRQDPDVIMVGEIRDPETAEIAVKAAQTGHLVLSTLHTNSAPEALARLRNMGIAGYNLATSVSLIIAQRLVRQLCKHCKKPLHLGENVLRQMGFTDAQIEKGTLFSPEACNRCQDGYRGRIGVYQVIPVTDSISRLIMDNGTSIQIAENALQSGFNDLRYAVLEKAAQGLTSLAEVNRLT